jgi:hypothetical protein
MSETVTESTAPQPSSKGALTFLAAIHLSVAVWHGGAHSALGVGLTPFQNLFVVGVILIAPLLATLLLWTRLEEFALWLYVIAMSASLLFGVYYHYIAVSPDNIHFLPPAASDSARHRFTYSAAAVAVTEAVAAVRSEIALFTRRSGIQT